MTAPRDAARAALTDEVLREAYKVAHDAAYANGVVVGRGVLVVGGTVAHDAGLRAVAALAGASPSEPPTLMSLVGTMPNLVPAGMSSEDFVRRLRERYDAGYCEAERLTWEQAANELNKVTSPWEAEAEIANLLQTWRDRVGVPPSSAPPTGEEDT